MCVGLPWAVGLWAAPWWPWCGWVAGGLGHKKRAPFGAPGALAAVAGGYAPKRARCAIWAVRCLAIVRRWLGFVWR